jgi:hypothetical protein
MNISAAMDFTTLADDLAMGVIELHKQRAGEKVSAYAFEYGGAPAPVRKLLPEPPDLDQMITRAEAELEGLQLLKRELARIADP